MSSYLVTTPASRHPRPTAVVLGAGIAGLTAAHELAERGFDVTVYESNTDERVELRPAAAGTYPPVKLGGLAASQYATTESTADGVRARLRPFPGRRGTPPPPRRAFAGEHGFRFFPAYYLHIGDLLQRVPVYEQIPDGIGDGGGWRQTDRTVMDNVSRVVTQATTTPRGTPSLIFPREAPRSLAELFTMASELSDFGYTPGDVAVFSSRLVRYLVTSPLRRAAELQNHSAYDFFVGRDANGVRHHFYTQPFENLILDMPKVLAAFDSRWGDARTNIDTYLQLQLQMDRTDNKADGVLNGPTTEAWFDHWYRHLVRLGVRFVLGGVDRIEAPDIDPDQPAHLRPRVQVVLTDGTQVSPDYVVAAVDAPAAERISRPLRLAGTGGTAAGLEGFTTSVAPPAGPLQPQESRAAASRDPYAMEQMGRLPWDRFQTLAGIQFYFDTEFQLVRGHVYYTGSEWGLSSINQQGLWERRPTLTHDGHVSVLSVDIGDFNGPSPYVVDGAGNPKAARDCTPDELAAEIWRQIVASISGDVPGASEAPVPWPIWYTLDRNLTMSSLPDGSEGPPARNGAPYLVPIVGDWENRPGSDPWNPSGTSWATRPTESVWLEDLEQRYVWQARHGGYQVHHNSLVFAGTWTKTFTRMTTMEAACESARHAVNAILDHYVWVETGGLDRRESLSVAWRVPFGFLDQGYSSPVRLPSQAGDYCFVFDLENREPLDARPLRNLDSAYFRAGLPHPLDMPAPLDQAGVPASLHAVGGSAMATSPNDYTGQLLAYLQAWRQYLEQAAGVAAPLSYTPPTVPGWPAPPAAPGPAGQSPGVAAPVAPVPGAQLPNSPPPVAQVPPSAHVSAGQSGAGQPGAGQSGAGQPGGGQVSAGQSAVGPSAVSLYSVALSQPPGRAASAPHSPSAFGWALDQGAGASPSAASAAPAQPTGTLYSDYAGAGPRPSRRPDEVPPDIAGLVVGGPGMAAASRQSGGPAEPSAPASSAIPPGSGVEYVGGDALAR